MGAQCVRRRAGQRGALAGSPALMPELLILALATAGRVPDDGRFAAAATHNVIVSKNIKSRLYGTSPVGTGLVDGQLTGLKARKPLGSTPFFNFLYNSSWAIFSVFVGVVKKV